MRNCPKCGAPLDELATVCSSCGSPVESSSKITEVSDSDIVSSSSARPTPEDSPPIIDSGSLKRPGIVTVLAIVSGIGGALLVYYAIPFLIAASQGGVPGVSQSVLVAVGVPFIIAGAVSLLATYGLIKRMRWAWRFALIVSIFSILQMLFITDLLNLVLGMVAMYLLTRPQVRAWFRPSQPGFQGA